MTQDKINILHLIKSLGRGGAETLLPETIRLHDKANFSFHCIYFLPWKDQMAKAIENEGARVTCFSATNNLLIFFQLGRIVRFIKKEQIQVIHCHLPWAGIVGRLAGKITGIPVIYTEHNKQERYHRLTYWLNRLTFNLQSRVVAVSNDVAQSIHRHIRPSVPIVTILNGVNTETFRRDPAAGSRLKKEMGIPDNAIVVGAVAVFRFQKRLEEWLEIIKPVMEKHKNVYGLLIGDGPLKEQIVSKRKELKLADRVFMPGLQTDVKPWLSATDIYMMSSLFEGLPIALLEAMSMECAVITTDAGGIKEVIRTGHDGLMVGVDDWKNLSASLMTLVEDASALHRFSKAGRIRVLEEFSLVEMVKGLEALYRNVISNK
jgi:glycosyltransferase involved in cell wall biosynthesis